MTKSNSLVTIGGVTSAVGTALFGIPIAVASSGATIPTWWSHCVFPFVLAGILLGAIGAALAGWAAKGQDEHSTQAQVTVATIEKPGIQAAAVQEAKIAAIEAPLKP